MVIVDFVDVINAVFVVVVVVVVYVVYVIYVVVAVFPSPPLASSPGTDAPISTAAAASERELPTPTQG